MKAAKTVPWWVFLISLVVLVDASLRIRAWHRSIGYRAAAKKLKVASFQTNGVAGVGVIELDSGKPLWIKWEGTPSKQSYYFQGQHVLDVWSASNRPPAYGLYFHGPGKSGTCWLNRDGAATFTERAHYDTNGSLSSDEIWYDESWQVVDRRNGRNGIIVNGEWRQLRFDTNGMWTTTIPDGASSNR